MQDKFYVAGDRAIYHGHRAIECVIRAYTSASGAPVREVRPEPWGWWAMDLPTAEPVILIVVYPDGEMECTGPIVPVRKPADCTAIEALRSRHLLPPAQAASDDLFGASAHAG